MDTYKARTLIEGYKLGKEYKGKYVAVPKQHLDDVLQIIHNEAFMFIYPEQTPVTEIEFTDKYGRGTYTLCYFLWRPTEQISLI